jgi:hypothetical protein
VKAPFRTAGAGADGFVAKFDPANVLAWSSPLGGGTPAAIALGPAGEVKLDPNVRALVEAATRDALAWSVGEPQPRSFAPAAAAVAEAHIAAGEAPALHRQAQHQRWITAHSYHCQPKSHSGD